MSILMVPLRKVATLKAAEKLIATPADSRLSLKRPVLWTSFLDRCMRDGVYFLRCEHNPEENKESCQI
jgi:hypothetical protein